MICSASFSKATSKPKDFLCPMIGSAIPFARNFHSAEKMCSSIKASVAPPWKMFPCPTPAKVSKAKLEAARWPEDERAHHQRNHARYRNRVRAHRRKEH